MAHVVTVAAIQVRDCNVQRILHRGNLIPEGVEADEVKRLVGKGFVEAVEPEKPKGRAAKAAPKADESE